MNIETKKGKDKKGITRFVYKEYGKVCKYCGEKYVATHNRSQFCNYNCGQKYRYQHTDNGIKKQIIKEGTERARKSFKNKTYEEQKKIWTKKNSKKSETIKICKYGTTDIKEIEIIKNAFLLENKKAYRAMRCRDPFVKMKSCLYRRLNALVRGDCKKSHFEQYLGCSFEEFKQYLESKFVDGMTWENHSRYGWHIDHIKPCVSFDLSKEDQIRECFNYKNLQPLWAKENLTKSSKLNWVRQNERCTMLAVIED